MRLPNRDIKRLAIFIFFDKESIVDDYVIYMLNSLKEAVNEIIIVSNSQLNSVEKDKLTTYSSKIIIRNNIGLDIGAFSEVYALNNKYIKEFDELVILNDTFYGPFKPFKTIFNEMATKNVDFWGLGANYNSVDGYGYLPDNMIHSHIQSYFMVFRNNILRNKAFNDYWKNYNIYEMNSFNAVVTKHELAFTYFLEQQGFKWDVYSNLSKYNSTDINANFNCYAYAGYEMLKNLNFPILKRKNLIFDKKDALFLNDGADAKRSLEYLKEKNIYNTDLIWKNIIRLYEPQEIYHGLNLNFVIKNEEENASNKNYVIILKLNNEKLFTNYLDIIKIIPKNNIKVLSENEKIINQFKELEVEVIDKNTFNAHNYDYICLVNDVYLKKQKIPTVFENNILNIIENGLKNVESIINIFEQNKFIGLLLLPPNYHSTYFDEMTDSNILIHSNTNCCWLKSELFDWNIFESYDFVQNYIKIVKKFSYTVGKVYNQNNAENILLNQEKIIQDITYLLKSQNNFNTATYSETINSLKQPKIVLCNNKNFKIILKKIKRRILTIFK